MKMEEMMEGNASTHHPIYQFRIRNSKFKTLPITNSQLSITTLMTFIILITSPYLGFKWVITLLALLKIGSGAGI